jgi:NADPH:quinone reductase
LTPWGANAQLVCVPEKYVLEVPEDLDPAEVVRLVFTYMTAYQMLHRAARDPGHLVRCADGGVFPSRLATPALEMRS